MTSDKHLEDDPQGFSAVFFHVPPSSSTPPEKQPDVDKDGTTPKPTLTKLEFWSIALFGSVVGLMTCLTVTPGASAALVALIFAMTGGSFLAFFVPKMISRENRQDILIMVGILSFGVLVGLFAGFLLRFLDPFPSSDSIQQPSVAKGTDDGKNTNTGPLLDNSNLKLFTLQNKTSGVIEDLATGIDALENSIQKQKITSALEQVSNGLEVLGEHREWVAGLKTPASNKNQMSPDRFKNNYEKLFEFKE